MDQFERGEVVELRKSPSPKGIVARVSDDSHFIDVKWVVPSAMEGTTTTHRLEDLRKLVELPQPPSSSAA